jgi:hypothetical protein
MGRSAWALADRGRDTAPRADRPALGRIRRPAPRRPPHDHDRRAHGAPCAQHRARPRRRPADRQVHEDWCRPACPPRPARSRHRPHVGEREGQRRTTDPRTRRWTAAAIHVPPAGPLDPDRPSQVPHPRPAAQLRHQPAQERRRHPSESRASSATPAPPPCATTATSPETSTYAPPWTTTRRPWPAGTCPRTSTRTRPPVRVGSPPSGPTRRRAHPRNSTQKPARKAERANAHA